MTSYTYNSADLLAKVGVDGRILEADTYDPAGNRTALRTPAGQISATYNAADQLVTWGRQSYSWSTNGNLARVTDSTGTTSFSFDDLGRLRRVTLPGGRSITYLVDAQGQRVGRQVNGRLVSGYLYDPSGEIVALTNGAGAVIARYGYDQLGDLALVEQGRETYRVVTDPNGSPLLVVNSKTGSVTDAITYNAWGQVTQETMPGTIPFGFDGGLVDPATGLVNLGARDYDPEIGRWTGPDPIGFSGGDTNLYRFAVDDPVNNGDPSGTTVNLSYPSPLMGPQRTSNGPGSPAPPHPSFSPPSIPPSPINPPPSTNPPAGGPPAPPATHWCFGFWCTPPIHNPDHTDMCILGGCGNGPAGFSCTALVCWGYDRNGDLGECILCSMGEPHLTTGGALHYDFQAAGEFTALESSDGLLDVQVRQQPDPGETWVTWATALAADVGGDRLGVYAREPSLLRVNGKAVNGAVVTERLPHGGGVARNGSLVTITWPHGGELAIVVIGDDNLSYQYLPGPGPVPALAGILGTENTATQLVDRDGSLIALSEPNFHKKLYSQFGNSWRISQVGSLFDYGPGQSTATFTDLKIPYYPSFSPASSSASARARASAICTAFGVRSQPLLDDCTLDVAVSGNPTLAAAEAEVASTGAAAPAPGLTEAPATKATTTSTTTTTTRPPGRSTGHTVSLGTIISGTINSTSQSRRVHLCRQDRRDCVPRERDAQLRS